jgi:hypothetical protein
MANQKKSVFEVLSAINVEEFVRGKNGFRYLSWSHAVGALLKHYPDAEMTVHKDGINPCFLTNTGAYVEVSVTIEGITRTQLHPVLDFRNQPIPKPNAFQVNTSIQRALAKAISLHGLGLYIYQGEDLPLSEKEATEQAREELKRLLQAVGKLDNQATAAIHRMNYDQLTNKINEYK